MSTALALSDGTHAGSLVVAPQSLGEVMQLADMMSKCTFVPKHLRGQPANCMAVCLQALRWSMDPFSVAQKTYFITEGSPPGYEAQLINAVILSRAPLEGRLKVEWHGDGMALACTVTGKFRGDPEPKTKTCRMVNIVIKNSPLWKSDPEQQLAYFTTRAWARLYCPDIILGAYTPDEVEPAVGPVNAKDVTPLKATSRLDALEEAILADFPSDAVPPEQHAAPDAGGDAPIPPPVGAPAGNTIADHVGAEFDLPPLDKDHLRARVQKYAAAKDREGLKIWRSALTKEANEVVSEILTDIRNNNGFG